MCGLILAGSATGRDLSRHNAGNQLGDFVDNQPERTAPVLPLRDVVVFPHMAIPLFVGREKSIHALDLAMEGDKRILLLAQKSAETDDPEAGDLYEVGTLAQVLQLLKLPDGTIKVLVEGVSRRSEEHTSELPSLMRTSYAVFCLKKKKTQ